MNNLILNKNVLIET